jgi:hypothetical protein
LKSVALENGNVFSLNRENGTDIREVENLENARFTARARFSILGRNHATIGPWRELENSSLLSIVGLRTEFTHTVFRENPRLGHTEVLGDLMVQFRF